MHHSIQTHSERVYAMDALRGIMMLLGIVIHTAITYDTNDYKEGWQVKDPSNSFVFNLVVAFIHFFRMKVFFLASGFFAAMLFYKKGWQQMLRNRLLRIALPFVAGVLLVNPLIDWSVQLSINAFAGKENQTLGLVPFIAAGKFLPFKLAHLWFLYFLVLYSVLGCTLALLAQQQNRVTSGLRKALQTILANGWLRITVPSFFLVLCLHWMGSPFVLTNGTWLINPSIFTTYFLFFGAGWLIYSYGLLPALRARPFVQLGLATLLFFLLLLYPWPNAAWVFPVAATVYALSCTLYVFGWLALFLQFFNYYSPKLQYLMQSAYWMYIIHLPIVVWIPGLMAGIALPAFAKFGITLSATFLLCLASYHYCVRGTFIGKFLNGKVYKKVRTQPVANEVALPT